MNEKLIVALDVKSKAEALEIVNELAEFGVTFKIGLQLFTAAGSDFVRELVKQGVRIFLDLKFHDIPNTVSNAAAEAARLGIWMFNVHALGGGEMLQQTSDKVREICEREGLSKPKIIAVTVLTSSNAETLQQIGVNNSPLEQVLKLARLTKQCNLDGVVASPLEAEQIRETCGDDFLIVTPGVRPKFAVSEDDQKRILTPAEAIKAGANYLVVGRPVLQASDRRQAVRDILTEIESAGD